MLVNAKVILKDHFGVHVLYRVGKGYTYIGPSVNIALARYIETFLLRASSDAWAEFLESNKFVSRFNPKYKRYNKKERKDAKCSFFTGYFNAIYRTLTERPIRNDADKNLNGEKKISNLSTQIETYIKGNFEVKEKSSNFDVERGDSAALYGGIKKGETVSLNRPVNEGLNVGQLAEAFV